MATKSNSYSYFNIKAFLNIYIVFVKFIVRYLSIRAQYLLLVCNLIVIRMLQSVLIKKSNICTRVLLQDKL